MPDITEAFTVNQTAAQTTPELPDDALIDSRELAAWVGVSDNQPAVWRWQKRGGPPYLKVGKYVRYRVGDVRGWLAGRVNSGTAER